MYGQSKLEDPQANHRIDMIMLAILVTYVLCSMLACLLVSSELTIILSLYSSATLSGKTGKMHLPLKL